MLYVVAQATSSGAVSAAYAGAFAAAFVIFILATLVSSRVQVNLEAELSEDVRLTLVRRILATGFESLRRSGQHDLYNVVTTDVGNITRASSILPSFALNIAKILTCMIVVAVISTRLFAALLLPVAVMVGLSHWLTTRAYRRGERMRAGQARTLEAFKSSVEGARELSADAAMRAAHYRRMAADAAELREASRSAGRAWAWNRVVTWGFLFAILGMVVVIGIALETPAVVATVILLATYCISAYEVIIQGAQVMSAALNSAKRIESLGLAEDLSVDATVSDAPLAREWQRLWVEDVTYEYASGADDGSERGFSVGPLSLTIARGEVVFIAGGNGTGKTTALHLLLGLLRPAGGQMGIDGERFDPERLHRWQSRFAAVHADFFLFPYVLDRDGNAADPALVNEYLALLDLDHIVTACDGVFSTTGLSRGQRKRLALAAVLASDRDIYLLDEWAADQDPRFRRLFYERLVPRLRAAGKTVVAITHDETYFHAADRVVVLADGRFVEPTAAATTADARVPLTRLNEPA